MGANLGSLPRSVGMMIVALGCGLSACDGPIGDVRWGADEVRGMRLVPGDRRVTVHFIDPGSAPSYTACWNTQGGDPVAGVCADRVRSPHEIGGLDNGVPISVAVMPRRGKELGPVVEVATTVPGPATRPLALHATMAHEDLDALYERDIWSDDLLPLDLQLGDESGPSAAVPGVRGIRLRGWSSRSLPVKSYHVRLDQRPEIDGFEEFNFRSQARAAGDRVLLTQLWTDPTGLRAPLAFAMYRELWLPSPSTYFVDWWLNGTFEGHYVAVERVDREALRGWGLNRRRGGATLVRDDTREHRDRPEIHGDSIFAINPETLGPDDGARLALLRIVFDHRGETEDQDWEALLELLRWSYTTPAGPAWAEGIEGRFDVDALVDFLALMTIQYDTGIFRGDNDYWLYRDHDGDGLWRLIPWDMDRTFGSDYYPGHPVANDFFCFHLELPRLSRNPFFERARDTLAERIDARVRELYLDTFTDAWWDATIDQLVAEVEASLTRWPGPAFERHPRQHATDSGWFPWHVEALREFHRLRRVWLLAARSPDGEAGRFEGAVELDGDGVAWLTDATGWVIARLEGAPGQVLDLVVEVQDHAGADGVERQWLIENRGAPWAGQMTLYYKHWPGGSWVPRTHAGAMEVAGRNWELTLVEKSGGRRAWLPTRVNPLANLASAAVVLEGSKRFRLLYRR